YDNVIYEIYNEPLSGCSWPNDIKPYAEAVIAAIRAIDPDNLIVVGSPEWSQRVDLPAADPITGYINIAYTIHFYPDMGHTSWLRSRASSAINDGIALMATEWGPKGYLVHEETTAWMDWCDLNYVSHTAWAVNDKDEPWSFLDPWIGMSTGGWSAEDLSTRGQVVKDICLNWDDTPPPPPDPELVGHWKLDENQGSTAADSSGKGNDGTLGGNPQWVAGKYGSALTFDGDDYVDLGNPSVLDFGTSDFTLCAWVKNPGGNNVIAKGGDQSGGIRYALQVGTTVQLLVDDNSNKVSVSGGSGLGDGEWHHVAGAKDGGVLRVYIDSGEVANGSLPYSPYDLSGTSQHNAYIGALWQHQDNMLGDFYTGSIDDARIYTWALSSGELAEVMGEDPNITPPAAPTGLSATAGDATVSLDWNDNTEPDLAGYDVYRSTTSGGPYSVIDFDLTQSDYTDNSVSNGTTYYYVVTAVDTNLNESAYSNEASATPGSGGEGVYQESGGECVMEAENATVDQRSDNITWSSETGHSGYIGSSYMTPPDNTGTTVTWSTGCELAWDVEISTAGTYYMAVRRLALDNGDDSARVGVGGSERDDNTFNGEATSWQWSRGTDFDLGNLSAGTHTIQIRRREDGFCVDRVMIADDWSKLPSDGSTEAGPAESPTGGDPPDTTPPAAPTGLAATAGDATVSLDWNDNTEPDFDVYDVYRSTSAGGPYSVIDF
ncbi:MAG: cellulase family glycosylhydrolase, partial [Planctomycetota bacterium]